MPTDPKTHGKKKIMTRERLWQDEEYGKKKNMTRKIIWQKKKEHGKKKNIIKIFLRELDQVMLLILF